MANAPADDEGWHLVLRQPATEIREERQLRQWEQSKEHWSGVGKHPTNWGEHKSIRVLDRELGVGSYGLVERISYKTVTMARKKVVPKYRITLEKLREEANAMERLAHKHILKLVGTYTLKNKSLYLLLYPVAVCDLSRFLGDIDDLRTGNCDTDDALNRLRLLGVKNVGTIEELAVGRVPVQRITASSSTMTAVGFLQQTLGCMTEALAFIHDKDIRHCDLKPKNILLSPGRVYLADFGIARDVREAEDSVTDSRCGTPSWMAPEVDDEQKHHKSPADIWALGCIFLNIATILYGEAVEKYDEIMKDHDWKTKYEKLPAFLDFLRSKATAAQFEDQDAPNVNFKHIINLIDSMLEFKPDDRPKAKEVNAKLSELGGLDQIYHLSCCHKDNTYVSTVLNTKLKSISDLNATSLVEIARLNVENQQMQERLAYLEMVHGTYEQRIENERRHAGEQYKALKEKYNQEVKAKKELEERVKSVEFRQPRRPRSQNRGRGKSQGALHGNNLYNGNPRPNCNGNPPRAPAIDTIPQNIQRRKSFLPVPSRPSTPLHTPTRPSPPGSSSSTLVSSSYSTFSRASLKTMDSCSSVASSTVRDTSPASPSIMRTTASQRIISRPPIPIFGQSPSDAAKDRGQPAKASWANIVRSASNV